jgi:hypothetical protein
VHFALHVPTGRAHGFDFKPLALPKLQGMSGGGIWRVRLNPKDGTVAEALLVGVGIEYHVREAALVATRIRSVLPLLQQDEPSLTAGPGASHDV